MDWESMWRQTLPAMQQGWAWLQRELIDHPMMAIAALVICVLVWLFLRPRFPGD